MEYVDSGASKHLAPSEMDFIEGSLRKIYDQGVKQADGTYLKATHVGKREIKHVNGTRLLVNEVFLVPKIATKLTSVAALNEEGFTLTFSPTKEEIRQGNKTWQISRLEKAWIIPTDKEWKAYISNMDAMLFHERMGHPGPNRQKLAAKA